MRKDRILKKVISWMFVFVMALSLTAPAQVKAASAGESSGTSDTSVYDALMQSDIEAAEPASSATVGWITSNQTETETTTSSSVGTAMEEWKRKEINDESSTFRQDVSVSNLLKEGLKKFAKYEYGEDAGYVYNVAVDVPITILKGVDDLGDAIVYSSPSSHAFFRTAEYAIGFYTTIADLYTGIIEDLFGKKVAKALKILPISILSKTLSYGRDYLDTDEVTQSLNEMNPWWLQALDWVFEKWEYIWQYGVKKAGAGQWGTNQNDLDGTSWRTRVPKNVNAYKPNIYLYGSAGETWTLTFDAPELLRAVLPEYEDAWTVTIAEDGSLTVNGEDSYGYLFYESSTLEGLMQKDEGFVLNASDREEQLREILAQYGFNETEIDDFVEYWCEKLDADASYIMCPQTTEAVDRLMPITLEGEAFDHYTRIWFYFEECDPAAMLPEPEIEQVFHDGNALVEWGGVAE